MDKISLLFTVLVTFFAGMGAGLGTGFAGMSAAAVISPMLITFLHMDPYMAVGIALSSDVLDRQPQRHFCFYSCSSQSAISWISIPS